MSKHLVNDDIVSEVVKLILEDGVVLGNIPLNEAKDIAEQRGYDLIQVSFDDIPVCKLGDYGKIVYNENKHKKSHKETVKEVKISNNIAEHDLNIKNKQIREFLSKNYKVKYIMEVKGRVNNGVMDLAKRKMLKNIEGLSDVSKYDNINFQDKNINVVLTKLVK
ncbi:MAG: translation initiation factor IF-3 [Clostridia bacterium]|jgi:translation initiation factor IF-3